MKSNVCRLIVVGLLLAARGANAAQINEVEGNNTPATAQNVDGNFTLDADRDIGDMSSNTSKTIPHVSILATGDDSFDYFSFTTVTPFSKVIFDIDHSASSVGTAPDTELIALRPDGEMAGGPATENDEALISYGAGGSLDVRDAYLETTFPAPGLYVIGVGRYNTFHLPGQGLAGNHLLPGDQYTLHISVLAPEPAAWMLALTGGGLAWLLRRRIRQIRGHSC